MEPVTKKVAVTFYDKELPGGTYATFKVGKEQWTAWPASKHRANLAITDRLIAALHRVRTQAIMFINAHPQDAGRIAKLLEIARQADEVAAETVITKMRVQTDTTAPQTTPVEPWHGKAAGGA